jgi:hypothetical protein
MKPPRLTYHRATIATDAVDMLAAAGDEGSVVGSVVHDDAAAELLACVPAVDGELVLEGAERRAPRRRGGGR